MSSGRRRITFRLGDSRTLSRDEARAACTTNFVLPGFGSLLGGRRSGYVQAILCLAGFTFTTLFGLQFLVWAIRHWAELYGPEADPVETLLAVWLHCRWALLGIAMFALAWVWALCTSLAMLHAAKKNSGPPPRIQG